MAKKKNQKRKQAQDIKVIYEIADEEMLTRAIMNALLTADKKKMQETEDKIKSHQLEFEKQLGLDSLKGGIKAGLNFVFHPKKLVGGMRSNSALIVMFLKFFYKLVEWLMLIICFVLISYVPLQFLVKDIPIIEWYNNILIGIWSGISFTVARMIRIAGYEIEKIEDKNYLATLVATITSIISMIIAIIAIVI